MEFKLYKTSGYEEAIMSLRMSKGKYFSWMNAIKIQQLVHAVTDYRGKIASNPVYVNNLRNIAQIDVGLDVMHQGHKGEISGNYKQDVEEFIRLMALTFNNAMGEHKHHTLMKYIDISFFTVGLHRGAQDDLDAHAIAFNNRITRFSTRLAEIPEIRLSEWYSDKVIPLNDAIKLINRNDESKIELPGTIEIDDKEFKYSPFGYILKRYADMSDKNGLYKDVHRGGMPLGMASDGIWKTDLFNLRYIYKMRSKLTKSNPELKEGMEQLADQIEKHLPMFGKYFRKELTDSGTWEHMNKIKTVTREEYELLKKVKREMKEGDA
ncbi:hypothetical protein BpsM61_00024 [Bacillus phage vB_BpsM-61]|nr:hypothetical protein BpsM61_00024 [Bacillus phage vB_BpsM-61]